MNSHPSRRSLVRYGLVSAFSLGALGARGAQAGSVAFAFGADEFGPLQDPDENGLMLPRGFTSRVVAVTGERVPGTRHTWHADPDGGATYAAPDGGWVYVSNAECNNGLGGVGALRFDASGAVVDAYSILHGTTRNCAGGPTPWGTWLSCEETSTGRVWECDPFAKDSQGVVHPALGTFAHEAAAVDLPTGAVYLTEDQREGLFYRFLPDVPGDLSSGRLQAAEVLDPDGAGPITPGQLRPLTWHPVPDPTVSERTPTLRQVPRATPFDGGEGCWVERRWLYFSTKGDNRVWRVDLDRQTIEIVYDRATSSNPILSGVDNVLVTPNGDVYVAEDGGDLQIVALTTKGAVKPVLKLVGTRGTELTGPALAPDGTRLYFSSQRNPGRTYAVQGPFLGS